MKDTFIQVFDLSEFSQVRLECWVDTAFHFVQIFAQLKKQTNKWNETSHLMPFSFILSVSWMTHWLKRRPVNCFLFFFRRTGESNLADPYLIQELDETRRTVGKTENPERNVYQQGKRNKERAGEAAK